MYYDRIEMTLEVRGEVRATAFPLRNHDSLKTIKEWEIYVTQKSMMQNSMPFRIEKSFPFLIKSQNNESTESESADEHCEPINPSGGLEQVVGRGQSQVL